MASVAAARVSVVTPDDCDLLAWINRAMAQTGWTKESLAAAMGKDQSYVTRVLNGDKPLNLAFLRELPDDLEAVVSALYAESFGLIVVAPARGVDAVRNLVSGLMGLLGASLPEKAGPPVKAMLDSKRRTG